MTFIVNKAGIIARSLVREYVAKSGKKSIILTKPIKNINFGELKPVSETVNIRGVIPINLSSEAAKFFGVDSLRSLNSLQALLNHYKLNDIMEKFNCHTGISTSLEKFKYLFYTPTKGQGWKSAKELCTPHFPYGLSGVKITFTGFKFNGQDALHSIGFIRDYNGNLFIIDSLGDTVPEMKEFHKKLANTILESERGAGNPITKVIFNSKLQQGENELTCNNWTLANLRAVREALNSGKVIRSSEELDAVLPNDINKILREQMELVKQDKSQSISL